MKSLILVCLLTATSLYAGYFIGRTTEVVCDDDVEFHPIYELYPDAYAGKYAVCGLSIVVVLD